MLLKGVTSRQVMPSAPLCTVDTLLPAGTCSDGSYTTQPAHACSGISSHTCSTCQRQPQQSASPGSGQKAHPMPAALCSRSPVCMVKPRLDSCLLRLCHMQCLCQLSPLLQQLKPCLFRLLLKFCLLQCGRHSGHCWPSEPRPAGGVCHHAAGL